MSVFLFSTCSRGFDCTSLVSVLSFPLNNGCGPLSLLPICVLAELFESSIYKTIKPSSVQTCYFYKHYYINQLLQFPSSKLFLCQEKLWKCRYRSDQHAEKYHICTKDMLMTVHAQNTGRVGHRADEKHTLPCVSTYIPHGRFALSLPAK